MAETIDSPEDKATPDKDVVLELNFVPDWARKPPSTTQFFSSSPKSRDSGDRKRGRRNNRPARDQSRDRPSRDRQRPQEGRRPASPQHRRPAFSEPPLQLRFVPEQKPLVAVVRKLRVSRRAYPLMDIVSLFLGNPASCRVKIDDVGDEKKLFQCKACSIVSLSRQAIETHLLENHLVDHFDIEETTTDPPGGNFVCVARCRMSGVLLGPPNHNTYRENVEQHRRIRFPDMSASDYDKQIETLKDEELIEAWKESCRMQTLYRRKGNTENGDALKWSRAAEIFLGEIAPTQIKETARASFPARFAQETDDERLKKSCEIAWRRECQSPRALMFAIRAALRHKRFFIFKAGKGQTFVTTIQPVPLDPERAVDNIREVLDYLRANPGCSRENLVDGLDPGAAPDSEKTMGILAPLSWLIEKGHIIEFFDGTLAVPLS